MHVNWGKSSTLFHRIKEWQKHCGTVMSFLFIIISYHYHLLSNCNRWTTQNQHNQTQNHIYFFLLQNFIDLAATVSTGVVVLFEIKLFEIRTEGYSKVCFKSLSKHNVRTSMSNQTDLEKSAIWIMKTFITKNVQRKGSSNLLMNLSPNFDRGK